MIFLFTLKLALLASALTALKTKRSGFMLYYQVNILISIDKRTLNLYTLNGVNVGNVIGSQTGDLYNRGFTVQEKLSVMHICF